MAAEFVGQQFKDYPDKDIKEVTQATLERKGAYANHFDPLVNLSSCIYNANSTDRMLFGRGIPDALLVNIVLGSE
jgi:hypothetical protein